MQEQTPNLEWDWRPRPIVSPRLPQNNVAPVWGAVGAPMALGEPWNPNAPAAVASKIAGFSGLSGLRGWSDLSPGMRAFWTATSTVGLVASVYHGYKRNRSIGWALVWGLFGSAFPFVTVPLALAQGYAKPKKR